MGIIKISSLFWLYKFKQDLQQNYKKMFYPKDDEFNRLWQMYVDNYYEIRELGLKIPDEMDFSSYFDCVLNDRNQSKNFTQLYKQKYKEFCKKMEETINVIDKYLNERE